MGLFFDDPKDYRKFKEEQQKAQQKARAAEELRRANDPKTKKWEAEKALARENGKNRELAEKAGFTAKNPDEAASAMKELVKRTGSKRKAEKIIEDMSISSGAKPKSLFRRFTGW